MTDTTGPKRTRIPPEDVDQLIEWAEQGKSMRWIGRKLGISQSAVYYHRLKAGIKPKFQGNGPAVNKAGKRRFTPEEDALLVQLRMDGATLKSIARQLNRGHSSIFMRLQIIGAKED
jgi:DNA-binding CsgD family transcriptional regulator